MPSQAPTKVRPISEVHSRRPALDLTDFDKALRRRFAVMRKNFSLPQMLSVINEIAALIIMDTLILACQNQIHDDEGWEIFNFDFPDRDFYRFDAL